jgi:translation initiation factor IF-1
MSWEYRGKLSRGDRVRVWIYGDDSLVKGKMGTVHDLDNAGMFIVSLDDGQVVMVVRGVDKVVRIDR